MALEDIFAAEPLIINRLKDTLTGVKTIGGANEIAGATDIAKLCDAVLVLPSAGDVQSLAGAHINEEQTWQIIIALAHYEDEDALESTTTRAGRIAAQVIESLHQHRLSADIQSLRYIQRGTPYYEPGYAEFPLLFQARAIFRVEKAPCP